MSVEKNDAAYIDLLEFITLLKVDTGKDVGGGEGSGGGSRSSSMCVCGSRRRRGVRAWE